MDYQVVVMCNDQNNAFDHVKWTFLLSVMQKIGFGVKWIGWIRWCISTTSFPVFVNGTPNGFFQSSRSLRQGDSLLHYLFVIAMDALSCLLKRAVDGGFYQVVRWREEWRRGLDFPVVVCWWHSCLLPSILRSNDLSMLVAYVVWGHFKVENKFR